MQVMRPRPRALGIIKEFHARCTIQVLINANNAIKAIDAIKPTQLLKNASDEFASIVFMQQSERNAKQTSNTHQTCIISLCLNSFLQQSESNANTPQTLYATKLKKGIGQVCLNRVLM